MNNTVIVTRHTALVELIKERKLVPRCLYCSGTGTHPAAYGLTQPELEDQFPSGTTCPCCRGTGLGAKVVAHATPEEIRGKHVIGVLPLHLAALAATVTEIPLALAPEDRGKELGIERLREIAGPAITYKVTVVEN